MSYRVAFDLSEYNLSQNDIYDLLCSLGKEDMYEEGMDLDNLSFDFDDKDILINYIRDSMDSGLPIVIQKI